MKLSGKFIKAGDCLCDFKNHVPAPYFRKTFTLGFKPEKAEATICGLGFYELYINGTNITKCADGSDRKRKTPWNRAHRRLGI